MLNIKYYLKNGTIFETPIIDENLEFSIVSYEIKGEKKFSYENDELISNIDSELVSLYDRFRDIYFPDKEGYYKQLYSMPKFIQNAGRNSDCAINTDLFNDLIEKNFKILGNDLYRHLYLVDCQYIIGTIQNRLCEMNDLFIRFYVDICETKIIFKDRFSDKTFHLTSSASRLLSATVESYFIKAYSILDLLTKIIYEIENPITEFDKYQKLVSSKKIWGDRKNTKFNNEPETLFEKCELVQIIESLRNEIVHNGSWELNPKLFAVNKGNNITEKFMLFPDFEQGRLSCVKNRKHFFSNNTRINDIFVELHFDFMHKFLMTVKKILAYTT